MLSYRASPASGGLRQHETACDTRTGWGSTDLHELPASQGDDDQLAAGLIGHHDLRPGPAVDVRDAGEVEARRSHRMVREAAEAGDDLERAAVRARDREHASDVGRLHVGGLAGAVAVEVPDPDGIEPPEPLPDRGAGELALQSGAVHTVALEPGAELGVRAHHPDLARTVAIDVGDTRHEILEHAAVGETKGGPGSAAQRHSQGRGLDGVPEHGVPVSACRSGQPRDRDIARRPDDIAVWDRSVPPRAVGPGAAGPRVQCDGQRQQRAREPVPIPSRARHGVSSARPGTAAGAGAGPGAKCGITSALNRPTLLHDRLVRDPREVGPYEQRLQRQGLAHLLDLLDDVLRRPEQHVAGVHPLVAEQVELARGLGQRLAGVEVIPETAVVAHPAQVGERAVLREALCLGHRLGDEHVPEDAEPLPQRDLAPGRLARLVAVHLEARQERLGRRDPEQGP